MKSNISIKDNNNINFTLCYVAAVAQTQQQQDGRSRCAEITGAVDVAEIKGGADVAKIKGALDVAEIKGAVNVA